MQAMKFCTFLHLYQPYDQQKIILDAVVEQSYKPLIQGFKKLNNNAKLTLNITGALLELFEKHGHDYLINDLNDLLDSKTIELTGSAKYHAFLPFLQSSEVERQINQNTKTLQKYFGKNFMPKGFFPPEMGVTSKLYPIIKDAGFEWVILDEIAYNGNVEAVDNSKLYAEQKTELKLFFRQRRISNLIMAAVARDIKTVAQSLNQTVQDQYVLPAMDGETFGHHRPGLEKLLFELLENNGKNLKFGEKTQKIEFLTISQLLEQNYELEKVAPIDCTWASSKKDIEQGIQFLSWKDPSNAIHKYQKSLTDLVLKAVQDLNENFKNYKKIRKKMDVALASDHFWWASAKPWWSVEMIEVGAYRLLEIYKMIPNITEHQVTKASELYENIVSTAFEWQRSGKIHEMHLEQNATLKIPFKTRTLETKNKEHEYEAFMSMMNVLEKKAARKGDYEKAILWRDAQYKLDKKQDIYDAINVIDLVRVEIGNEKVEKTIKKYENEYKRLRGGQPEQRE